MMLKYTQAQPDDVQSIFTLCRDLIERYEDLSQIDSEKVLSWVLNKIQTHISEYTCVWKDEQKVAYYRLSKQDTGMELDDLYVLSEYRGQGIGSEILNKCVKETGGTMFLYVFTRNHRAISLYKRFGFVFSEQVGNTRCVMVRQA